MKWLLKLKFFINNQFLSLHAQTRMDRQRHTDLNTHTYGHTHKLAGTRENRGLGGFCRCCRLQAHIPIQIILYTATFSDSPA